MIQHVHHRLSDETGFFIP